jgi:hypothetical protein
MSPYECPAPTVVGQNFASFVAVAYLLLPYMLAAYITYILLWYLGGVRREAQHPGALW